MKKIIAKILIVVILITFIMPKFSLATNTDSGSSETQEVSEEERKQQLKESYESFTKRGEVSINSRMEQIRETPSGGDAVASLLGWTSSVIAEAVRALLTITLNDGSKVSNNITIANIVNGDYPVLNNEFILQSGGGESVINNEMRDQVSGWYYAIRTLAIVIGLFVLLYVGIRMVISTLAEDKVKYKKMIIAWLQSFILIFFLHYIMILAMAVQRTLMDMFSNVLPQLDANIENSILGNCLIDISEETGWNIIFGAVLYWVITYYQVKFFLLYAKRMVSTAFLIIIAPLITVTYSIDKAGDGEAQAFKIWMKEFFVNVFIQPVHYVVYAIFVVSASEIAVKLPLFTIIFFGALSRGEKIIKGLFGMRSKKSIHSLGK